MEKLVKFSCSTLGGAVFGAVGGALSGALWGVILKGSPLAFGAVCGVIYGVLGYATPDIISAIIRFYIKILKL